MAIKGRQLNKSHLTVKPYAHSRETTPQKITCNKRPFEKTLVIRDHLKDHL
jgi:hypothetical protein